MKTVILAGGLGTRIGPETHLKPKPMIEIGDKPILWHIMKIYSSFGVRDFIICLGYKGYLIKEYFSNYVLHTSDVTIDMQKQGMEVHQRGAEPWRITLIDTGLETMTGGRIKRIREYLEDETFLLTYGDGLADIDIGALVDHHTRHGKLATLTSVLPPGRFGALQLDEEGNVLSFTEKPRGDGSYINGGFFVLEPKAIDSIEGDATYWEREPLERLASSGQLVAYKHEGFWHPMDTLRDKKYLEDLWAAGKAPWKVWVD